MDSVLAGEATPEERGELDRLSAADPAIREMVESRGALFATLRSARSAEPPPELRESILEAVRRLVRNFADPEVGGPALGARAVDPYAHRLLVRLDG